MKPKENARPVVKQSRAHVRKHAQSISRDPEWWAISRRDEIKLGAVFCAVGLLIVLWGAIA